MITSKVSDEEMELLLTITQRSYDACRHTDIDWIFVEMLLDLINCHAEACALDLEAMTTWPIHDVIHDLIGIRNHLNRETKKLENCFVPRFARRDYETH